MVKTFMKLSGVALMICMVPVASIAQSNTLRRVEGAATAAGSDSVEVAGEVFFLAGMVVPTDTDGSRSRLSQLVSGQKLVCTVQETSQGSRQTAICLAGSKDVSRAMVRSGAALSYAENNLDFLEVQELARQEGLGLWVQADTVDRAAAFANGSVPPRDCAIKGNKGRQKPYALKFHRPGDAYYTRTKINIHKGESWFCSTSSAEAAGFIASGN